MNDDAVKQWRLLLPPWLRFLPADLLACLGFTLLTVGVTVVPLVRETPIRFVFGILFVSFVPGYALVAALFPRRASIPDVSETVDNQRGITVGERTVLSVGLSIVCVTLVGLALNSTPWRIRLTPILVSLSALVFVLVLIAARRRQALSVKKRFSVSWREPVMALRSEILGYDSRRDTVLTVLLFVSLLFAVGSIGYAIAVPTPDESYTEFYLLTEQENGNLTASDYPTTFTAGVPEEVVVAVESHERESTTYTVLVEIQRVQANGSTTVIEHERLDRLQAEVGPDETWQQKHTVVPSLTGDRLRLTYLLYRGEPPKNPTVENAFHDLQIWVNVTEG